MEIYGLEKHQKLQQYLNDIEIELSNFEQGLCPFEKVAINFRWCVEYILREYQKEYPNCAAADTFNTIKNLQELRIIDRQAVDVLHQVRKIGNKGGAHLTEEETSIEDIRRIFDELVNYIPQFLATFPEPSKKKISTNQNIKVEFLNSADSWVNTSQSQTIEMLGAFFNNSYTLLDEITVDAYTEINGTIFYNSSGIIKATRTLIDSLKTQKIDNAFVKVPGAAQISLGFSVAAHCCEPEPGNGRRNHRYWDYARPNKLDYFEAFTDFGGRTLTLPDCFAEDAFDKALSQTPLGVDPYLAVVRRSWSDVIKTDDFYQAYEDTIKYHGITKIILPEYLRAGCLSWLNLFPDLEEVILPPSMYIQDGIIYLKKEDSVLALLRNKIDERQINQTGIYSYIYPGADWGSGYVLCDRVDGVGKYLATEEFVKAERIREEHRKLKEQRQREAAQRQAAIRRRQEQAQAQQAQAAANTNQAQRAQTAANRNQTQSSKNKSTQVHSENHKNKLYRSRKDSIVAGVCGGIAKYFNIDSKIVRVIFAVLLLFPSFGWVAYLLLAIFVPREPEV